jgi:hypothetical protein
VKGTDGFCCCNNYDIFRRQPKNMLLCGLWFSDKKPVMNTFLEPIIKQLKKLESEGITLDLVNDGILCNITVTLHVISLSCDLPARALIQNFIQFNGEYGCSFCEQPGESYHTGKGGTVHIFPFNHDSPAGPSRTKARCIQHAKDAINENKVVTEEYGILCNFVRFFQIFGVKGPTWLSCLKSLDFIKGMSVDYMHCALLGVSKLLVSLWIETSRCVGTDHNIRAFISSLDQQLLHNIKIPSCIRRKPRGLSELKHWKASEFRSLTLFYGVCLLKDCLPEDYYRHFLLFSEAL